MDADLYREILLDYLFPFMASKYDFDCILLQDNDPKHSSVKCRSVFSENDIKWVNFCFFGLIFINRNLNEHVF